MPLLILIADDNVGVRLAISDYLETQGYATVDAANGEEALKRLESYHPHLLIADIRMPLRDGYELVQQVRRRPEFRLLPVIFLTECDRTEERIRGYQVGCDLYLPKPFEMDELGAIVRNLLERAQAVQAEMRFPATETTPLATTTALATALGTVARAHDTPDFTDREQQVLALLVTGLSNNDMGDRLHLSSRTVEKYVSSLLRKTETNNRAELVRFAFEHQLVH
ncbi:MAG: response regulator transcription factor [Spirulinaceae cyanobacterium SM2_1_0]|nr:response regulator transcription factor [Spirulinaceae cyanobacterium SM2_1_0]